MSNSLIKIKKQKGFTLLEVIVALAVLSLGMITLVKSSNQNLNQTFYLKNKTIAQWVAVNKVNEVKILGWPDTGNTSGSEFMAEREWFWKMKVSKTSYQDIRNIEISIRLQRSNDEPLLKLISSVSNL